MFFKWLRSLVSPLYLISSLLFLALSLCGSLCFGHPVTRDFKAINFLNQSQFDYSAELKVGVSKNCFYSLGREVGLSKDESSSKPLNAIGYMAEEKATYDDGILFGFSSPSLNSGGVIVSEPFMAGNNLNDGDIVFLSFPTETKARPFVIRGTLRDCYGISDIDPGQELGVFIFGYSSDLSSLVTCPHTFFYQEGGLKTLSESGVTPTAIFSKRDEVKKIDGSLFVYLGIALGLDLIGAILLCIAIARSSFKRNRYLTSVGSNETVRMIADDYLIGYGTPATLSSAILLLVGLLLRWTLWPLYLALIIFALVASFASTSALVKWKGRNTKI